MKRLVSLLFSLLLFSLLLVPAFAHPGGTDGAGGHYDHSTGEYHYHHGYGAHQHYDMNDDGIDDCQYDPPKATPAPTSTPRPTQIPHLELFPLPSAGQAPSHSSIWNSSEKAKQRSYYPKATSIPTPNPTSKPITKFSYKSTTEPSVHTSSTAPVKSITSTYPSKRSMVILFFSPFSLYFIFTLIRDRRREREAAERQRIQRIKSEMEIKQFLSEQQIYIEKYKDVSTLDASGAPPLCFVGEDGLPAIHDDSSEKWGAAYTFYITSDGSAYHTRECGCIKNLYYPKAMNAAQVLESQIKYSNAIYHLTVTHFTYRPCLRCHPTLPDISWYKKYKEIKAIRDKYNIPEP